MTDPVSSPPSSTPVLVPDPADHANPSLPGVHPLDPATPAPGPAQTFPPAPAGSPVRLRPADEIQRDLDALSARVDELGKRVDAKPPTSPPPTGRGGDVEVVDYEVEDPIFGNPLGGVGIVLERGDDGYVLVAPLVALGVRIDPEKVSPRSVTG